MTTRPEHQPAPRLRAVAGTVCARLAAAVLGGYALASTTAVAMAGLAPAPRADAVLGATLASFTAYLAAILWAFAARSATRAWLGLAGSTALAGGLAWWAVRGVAA